MYYLEIHVYMYNDVSVFQNVLGSLYIPIYTIVILPTYFHASTIILYTICYKKIIIQKR